MFQIDRSQEDATMQLWRQHAEELLRFATVLVGPTDAHDVVVEAFLRASTAASNADNPRAYLFRAITNHAHDLRRARSRRWARDLAAVRPATFVDPDPHLDVRRAVAALSVGQRAVIYLVFWQDHTERQVAEILSVSPGTVRRHLTRAHAHLRKALR